MSNRRLIGWVLIIGAFFLAGWYIVYVKKPGINSISPQVQDGLEQQKNIDIANLTYNIEGREVTLIDGLSETPTSETRLFDINLFTDVNGDGLKDETVILVDQPGGSGTFYYLFVVFGQKDDVIKMTKPYLLGDRIDVKTLSFSNSTNRLTVIFLDRKPGQPFSATPTLEKRLRFKIENGELLQFEAVK